jgi:membrane associated rhomboid family serine protease
MMNITPTVKQLLIINVLFFICSYFVPAANDLLALHYFENPMFQPWQIITHMFMHGNIMHIAFNMFALYSFGSMLEHFWGAKKFIFFYISCGLGAMALHTLVNYLQFHHGLTLLQEAHVSPDIINSILTEGRYNDDILQIISKSKLEEMYFAYNTPVVGASGAIYGLLVAFAFMFPNTELMLMFIPVPIKAKYFVPGLLCVDLVLGVGGNSLFGGGDGVAHFAHIGGALIGFIMMWYWKKNQFNQNRWN